VARNAKLTRLEENLDHIREAPADGGTVELIARRPAVDEREVLREAWLDVDGGLEGDTWYVRGNSRTPDGGPDQEAQLTLMNARAAAAIAGEHERWPLAGEIFRQPDLARTLKNIAKNGADAFYRGPLAAHIAQFYKANGGVLSREDLASYQAKWVTPISTNYRGYTFYTQPPSSSAASSGTCNSLTAVSIV